MKGVFFQKKIYVFCVLCIYNEVSLGKYLGMLVKVIYSFLE